MKQQLQTHFTSAPTDLEFRDWLDENYKTSFNREENSLRHNVTQAVSNSNKWTDSRKYDDFRSQSIELGMFVPVGENGEVLDKPLNYEKWLKKAINTPYERDLIKYEQYQKALSKVIFKGFEVEHISPEGVLFKQGYYFSNKKRSLMYVNNGVIGLDQIKTLSGCAGIPITPNYFNFLDV